MNTRLPPLFALSQSGSNALFFCVMAVIGVILAAGLVFGIMRWQRPPAKAVAITSGVLLLALAAFTILVLVLDWSARHGSPM